MPTLRLQEYAENDLQALKVKRWRQMGNSREEWAYVVKEAKVLRGAQSQGACNYLT
jgi:hypothetical protein